MLEYFNWTNGIESSFMSTRHLDALFRPRSVAFIGATNRPRKLGAAAMRNLIRGGFEGKVYPLNPKYESVFGVPTFKTVDVLPEVPDLAIIATPPKTVPGIIQTLSSRYTFSAVFKNHKNRMLEIRSS